jgi:mono/diheme cytochrome c family protein
MVRLRAWGLFTLAFGVAALIGWPCRQSAEEPGGAEQRNSGPAQVFLKQYCQRCHGADRSEGELRLHQLGNPKASAPHELDVWARVLERLEAKDMPPRKEPQPAKEDVDRLITAIRGALSVAGRDATATDSASPRKANALDHVLLFGKPATGSGATEPRLWRISPSSYLQLIDELARNPLTADEEEEGSPIGIPFGLTSEPGFRDYAFRYRVGASEIEQLAMNAKVTVAAMLTSP